MPNFLDYLASPQEIWKPHIVPYCCTRVMKMAAYVTKAYGSVSETGSWIRCSRPNGEMACSMACHRSSLLIPGGNPATNNVHPPTICGLIKRITSVSSAVHKWAMAYTLAMFLPSAYGLWVVVEGSKVETMYVPRMQPRPYVDRA